MGEVIWVEVLSRQRDVVARYRCVGPDVRVGRSYGNNVIVDDPYVAPQHLRIARDEHGALVAEDLGSANGLFADNGTERLARIVLDGDRPIRIGRTYLRIREVNQEVSSERPLVPQARLWLRLLALTGAIVAIEVITLWLGETAELKLYRYVLPLLSMALVALAWAGLWTILSRIFSGHARFDRHLLITLAGLLMYVVYGEFTEYGAFAVSWQALATYAYLGRWLVIATVCFVHLREIGPSRFALKGAAVTALAVLAIVIETLVKLEMHTRSGHVDYVRDLKPPALRLTTAQSEQAFLADVEKLKAKLDRARLEVPPSHGLFSDFDLDD